MSTPARGAPAWSAGPAEPPGGPGQSAGAGRTAPVTGAHVLATRRTGTARASGRGWLRLVSPLLALGAWQVLSSTGILPPSRLASPASIAHTAYTLIVSDSPTYGTLQASVLVSLGRWGIGFSLGTAIAVLLAVATGLSRIAEAALDPIVQALRSVPLLGVLRLGVVTSLLALVVGEQINANAGLGFMITQAEQFLQNNVIVVTLIVYAILGLAADALVRLLARRALRWRHDFA